MKCGDVREYVFAFLDSELDAPLSIELQRHLERCPVCAREVEIERTIRKQLETMLEIPDKHPPLDEDSLRPGLTTIRQGPALHRWTFTAISTAVALLIGLAMWLWLTQADGRPTETHFADLVVTDYQHFLDNRQSVQFASEDSAEVSGWLQTKTGLKVTLPHSQSGHCTLVGARECKIARRTVGFVLYKIGDMPASLIVADSRAFDLDHFSQVHHEGRTHWVDRCKGHNVVACERDNLLYAAVSSLPEKELFCLMTATSHESN
ncbi:MAG: zf-HC2 domain-containing protein [Phycisphaerales bacterium]|nr:zf-HC2 domain-containing protein [Phycisphaerales bacterium]